MATNGTEIGSAWVSILPDLSSLAGGISKGMKSASAGAAKAFTAGMKGNLGGLSKAFSEAGKDAGEALAKSALSAAKSDIAKLSKSLASATNTQADALGRLRVAQEKLTEVQNQAKPKASALAAAEEAVAKAQRGANTATANAEGLTAKLTAAQDKAKKAAGDLEKAQSSAAKSGSKFGGAFSNAFKSGFTGSKTVTENLDRVDGGKVGRGLATRFGVGFNGLFGGIVSKSAGLLAATFATVGIGSFLKSSVNLEASFSQTMNVMAAVAKVPAAQIKALSALALQMGKDTTFSAGEAATAMLELAKGGLDAATIKAGALKGTLTLAAAGGTDLATAATIASNALNTFKLAGSETDKITAALAGGANASTASIESLGFALAQVGPGARNAGLDLNDTVGVLASFDNAGIKGSDAGTSLKTMLARLVPQTNKARDAMADLGLKFTDANGSFLPITNIAEQLKTQLSGLSEEQRSTALTTLFGSDATRAATVLMNEGSAGIQKYITATKDQNAANQVAAARMSGTAGAIEQLKGSIETAKIQLGLFLAPVVQAGLLKLTDLVNGIAPAFKRLTPLFAGVRGSFYALTSGFQNFADGRTTGGIAGLFERIGITAGQVFDALKTNVLPVVAGLAKNLKDDLLPPAVAIATVLAGLAATLITAVGPAFVGVTGFIKDNATTFQALAVGIGAIVLAIKAYRLGLIATQLVGKGILLFTKAWTIAQAALDVVLNANPISLIVLALIGLVAGLIYAYKHSTVFRNIVNGVFNSVKGVVLTVVGALVTAFHAVSDAIGFVVNFVKDHWKLLLPLILGPIIGIPLFIALHWGKIKQLFMDGVAAVLGGLKTAWGAIVGVFGAPVLAVVGVLSAIWSRIYPILVLPFYIANAAINAVWNLVKAAFTAVKDWVVGTFSKAWSAVSGVLSGPINTAKTWIGQRFADIRGAFTAVKDWVVTVFSKAWARVAGVLSKAVDDGKAAISAVFGKIRDAFTGAKDWVTGTFSKAWNAVKEKLTKPISDAKDAIGHVLSAEKNGLQNIFSTAVSGIGRIWDGLQNLAKKPVKFIIDTVLNDGLIDGFNWIANKFQAPTIPRIPLPKGFADGGQFSGRLPGAPSAVDNMFGLSAAGPVPLATGEFITNAKDTARALPLLKHINGGGDLPGFADGGLFGKLKGAATSAFNAGKSFSSDALKVLEDPVKWFKDRLSGPLNRLNELGSSPTAEIVKAVPRNLVNTVAGKAKDLLGIGGGKFNAGLGGVLDFVRSQVGKPYVWGGVGPAGYDCSGLVSAAINVALGRNPYQRLGATGSMPWSMFESGSGAFNVGWFQGNPGHTAATVNGTNIESSGGRGVHMGPGARGANDPLFTNHARVKGFAKGGLFGDGPFDLLDPRGKAYTGRAVVPKSALSFDAGRGYIPEGYSTVFNGTGSPEPLKRADAETDLSLKSLTELAGMVAKALDVVEVRDVNNQLIGAMRVQAKKVQEDTASDKAHEFGLR